MVLSLQVWLSSLTAGLLGAITVSYTDQFQNPFITNQSFSRVARVMSLAHGNQTLTDLSIHPWSQHADDQINPEIAGVTYLATGCCPIRRSNWTLSKSVMEHGDRQYGHRAPLCMKRRQLSRGTYLRIQLPNPEIEPTHMQAILTLVVKQALANSCQLT